MDQCYTSNCYCDIFGYNFIITKSTKVTYRKYCFENEL